MNPTVIIIGVAVFAVMLFVLSKVFSDKSSRYKKRSLEDISRGDETQDYNDEDLINNDSGDSFADSTANIPVIGHIGRQLKLSGSNLSVLVYIIMIIFLACILGYVAGLAFQKNWLIGGIIGFIAALTLSNIYLNIQIEKRNRAFLDNFPDSIDIIVRGVKAGQPLLTTLRTIAQSGEPPLNVEFQKVVDEVSYGRPLTEALYRMTERIGLLDLNFFAVILSIQQETGGNLAEVLGNLSDVIRKRKKLRLKIKALTAEGRLTSYIFAAIPFLQLGAVYLIARDYLDPLFTTQPGNVVLVIAACMIGAAIFISKKISNVRV